MKKITALPEFLDADCFFAYMDFKKEVMTRDLIEKALQMGKTVAVPRVEGDDMVYYEIKDFSTLKSGYFWHYGAGRRKGLHAGRGLSAGTRCGL